MLIGSKTHYVVSMVKIYIEHMQYVNAQLHMWALVKSKVDTLLQMCKFKGKSFTDWSQRSVYRLKTFAYKNVQKHTFETHLAQQEKKNRIKIIPNISHIL